MPVNLEVKGMLAKCLAMENLVIEHKKVSTAMFDVDRRILTLPMWEKASAIVYDLLVAHEVGHSLATPNIDWTIDYPEVPKDFVNVIEDARVERLMKKKYAGLSKTFYNGYNELNDDDFFGTKEENLNKLSLIDRINLYFKIGAFHNIAFSDEENEFLTRISKLETFAEVLETAQDLVNFLKQKKQESIELPANVQNQGQSGKELDDVQNSEQNPQDSMDLEQDSQQSSSTNQESQGDENITMEQESPTGGGNPSDKHVDELESKTSRSFDQKKEDLVDRIAQETNYVELPEMILENIIIPHDYIHKLCKNYYAASEGSYMEDWMKHVHQEYMSYKKTAEKEVSYLVKEFECKKSADQYARSSTARTGVLDTSKLHTYKFNEDLFKKVSVIPDGKNHGLVFILDWSGSMSDWMLNTCKQLFNLIWFCRKVNIPFEVYAFTLDCNAYVELQPNHPEIHKKKAGVIAPEKSFRLMNLFTHKANAKTMDEQMKYIWNCCYSFQKRSGYVPKGMDLSGTPLGETFLTLHSLIPQFQRNNKLQKVNVIFLTDGEGYVNASTVNKKRNGETYVGLSKHYDTTLRNRKNGRIYESYQYGNFPQYAKVLLTSLKDSFPTVNFINFRITPSRDFRTCHQWYGKNYSNYEEAKNVMKKNQFVTFYGTGFDQFHVIPSNTLAQDETFDVEEGASKAQIKTAFTKMLGKKKTNKKLLSEFVELIA